MENGFEVKTVVMIGLVISFFSLLVSFCAMLMAIKAC